MGRCRRGFVAAMAAAVVLGWGIACTGGGDTTDAPTPKPWGGSKAPDLDPSVRPDPGQGGGGGGGGGASRDAAVQAYLRDCHHVFPFDSEYDVAGDATNECLAREFDQNCSPDLYGCYDAGETCRDACGKPCDACQDACAGVCDDCVEDCSGKSKTCKHPCAVKRADCRTTCLDAKQACESACGTQESTCYEDAEKKKAKLCPRCSEIGACLMDGSPEQCKKQIPSPSECFEWCSPGQ